MRRCEVYMHGIKAGVLTEEDNRTFCFTYDKAYLLNEKSGPVSLTLPLQAEPYRSNVLFPVFANMLSEGENRQDPVPTAPHRCRGRFRHPAGHLPVRHRRCHYRKTD